MSESCKLKPCYEINPRLDEESVRELLQRFADVLGDLWFNMHEFDDRWITGCRAYGWIKNYLEKNQKSMPGIEVVSTSMDFVFSLNKVPLQFVTDNLDAPKKRHRLLKNDAECHQLSIFGEEEATEHNVTWRVFAEKYFAIEDDNEPPTWVLTLVGFNSFNRAVSKYELQSRVTSPVQQVNTELLPKAVDTPPAQLQRRVKVDKKADSDRNGTV
ncbi:hypothetical protein AB6I73_003910 [Citrobacter amalonaticus]